MKYSTKILINKDKRDFYRNQAPNSVCKSHQMVYRLVNLVKDTDLNFINLSEEMHLFHKICNTITRLLN